MRARNPVRHCFAPQLQRLIRAPLARRHADVGHGAEETLLGLRGVRDEGHRVAMHRPAVPQDEVAGLGLDEARSSALGDYPVVHLQLDVVPRLGLVLAQDLAVEAVGAWHDDEAAPLLARVRERHQALNAAQTALGVRLVDVVPVLLLELPRLVDSVRPEDAGTVEGGHQRVRAPDAREGLLDQGHSPQVPHERGLANAARVDDAVLLLRRPSTARHTRVLPRGGVFAVDLVALVARLQEIPEQAIGVLDLLLVDDAGDDDKTMLVEVLLPGVRVLEVEAPAEDGPDGRELALGDGWRLHQLDAEQILALVRELDQPLVHAVHLRCLLAHLLHAFWGSIVAKLGYDLGLHLIGQVDDRGLRLGARLAVLRREVRLVRVPELVLEVLVRVTGLQLLEHLDRLHDGDLRRIPVVGPIELCLCARPRICGLTWAGVQRDRTVHHDGAALREELRRGQRQESAGVPTNGAVRAEQPDARREAQALDQLLPQATSRC
mmetsp:Transcript_104163/g.324817  ORF Transcript_104163/g.324817 Transcript_104163/m.324817 type:complete len:492 (+) Transcript_104163:581-2056(+)